jgi:hypothetical protein
MQAVIEINDRALRGVSEEATIVSPGFAYVGGHELLIGDAALTYARLHPRQTLHHFWQRLDTNPIASNKAGVRHHADVAYQQLLMLHRDLGKPDDVMFVLPASFSKEQMALLLGLAQQCPFNAVAIVDYAVASLAGEQSLAQHNGLLELQLHQSAVYQVSCENAVASNMQSRVHEKGYMELLEQCAVLVAREFVAQCRFDPFHDAESEQQLFAAVHACLQRDEQQYAVEIESAGRALRARIERAQVDEVFSAFSNELMQSLDHPVNYLGANLAAIPGLRAQFADATALAPQSAALHCLAEADALRSYANSLAFTSEMRWQGAVSPAEPIESQLSCVTHYLVDARAYALPQQGAVYFARMGKAVVHSLHSSGSAEVIVSCDNGDLNVQGCDGFEFIHNGQRVKTARLQRGDSLQLEADGCAIGFIELVTGDAQ